jgi:hypothetical protein
MTYALGSLVEARGREWVVLPESEEDLLVLRPIEAALIARELLDREEAGAGAHMEP